MMVFDCRGLVRFLSFLIVGSSASLLVHAEQIEPARLDPTDIENAASTVDNWSYDTIIDPMTDQSQVVLSVAAARGYQGSFHILCTSSLSLAWSNPDIWKGTYDPGPVDVKVRFDQGPILSGPGLSPSRGDALSARVVRPRDVNFLARMMTAKSVVVQVTDANSVRVASSVFDLQSAKSYFDRLAADCDIALPLEITETGERIVTFGQPYDEDVVVNWDGGGPLDYIIASEAAANRFCSELGYGDVVSYASGPSRFKVADENGKMRRGDKINSIRCKMKP